MAQLISSSAEHHFLTTLGQLKSRPNGWVCLHFKLSQNMSHSTMVEDLESIPSKVAAAQRKRDAFVDLMQKQLNPKLKGYIYTFADFDVFALVQFENENERTHTDSAFKILAKSAGGPGMAETELLMNGFRKCQQLADEKILSARRFDAYEVMADENKVGSIAERRKLREEPLVMVVEDDRFTRHYASSILNKEYDMAISKNGEEAIELYIENAPDIVFLDIHLPGLSGHQVLEAIAAVDPEAFVVMLSVDSVKDNIQSAAELGAKKFLKKPFSKERLIETVKNSPYVKEMMLSNTPMGSTNMIH